MKTREEYAAWIAANRIRRCTSTPCPKCGLDSPCCDHIEVDIGVGVETGEHEFHCVDHGAFGFSYHTGEVVFRDDAPAPKSLDAAYGKWPGDETDAELASAAKDPARLVAALRKAGVVP